MVEGLFPGHPHLLDRLSALKGKDSPSVTAEDDWFCDRTYRFRFPCHSRGVVLVSLSPVVRLSAEDGFGMFYRTGVA